MLNYDKDTKAITMVAKDTGAMVIAIDNYLLDAGDKVYFTVNDGLEKENPFIQKVITTFTDNKALVELSTTDTDIPVGNYYYDVEVDTADGRVDTVIGPAKFKIVGGVKY